jgi:thiamine-monophosphate kinase
VEQVAKNCSLYAGTGFGAAVLILRMQRGNPGTQVKESENDILERMMGAFVRGRGRKGGDRLHKALGTHFVALGMGDDAALLRPARGSELVLTCDWFLEGTHFLRDKHPADAVGWKCLARAVSDVAAMGGTPRCFLLSLALPKGLAGTWLDEFLGGLRRAAARFDCWLAGGDTTASRRELLINVTIVGEVASRRGLRRSGARVGDVIYVSGRLGEAELGLGSLRGAKRVNLRDARLRKHLYPEARVELGRWLIEKRVATAMMDLSDGLSSDLGRLCLASGVGAVVEAERLPTVRRAGAESLRLALHGGDDYELLFTVAREKARSLPRSVGGVALTAIGEITRGRDVMVVGEDGSRRKLEPLGWDPFRRSR